MALYGQISDLVAFPVPLGDGINTIPAGLGGDYVVPFNFYILAASLQADAASALIVDIWAKAWAANSPPTLANTITAAALPTLLAVQSELDTTLTAWTRKFAGSPVAPLQLRFNVSPAATAKLATLTLIVRKF